ncbi:M48 family metallopeptidase [Calothrix sp. UHCC 0171]|uniref:M48 family metallopeptidase n=1 Tax=Calothrix sp. UHCC 0171 TaxID=3110245 RepID=UPI002B215C3E|nr:M48 family metallopeptidase [Calothrix sp. UHCC 0171]MEA5574538.1 M48 family metallopeptidase [Calothrix sp. UHCC 0171]
MNRRRWKPIFLSASWFLLSLGTSVLVILTQPLISPAQETVAPESTVPNIETSQEVFHPVFRDNNPQDTFTSVDESEINNRRDKQNIKTSINLDDLPTIKPKDNQKPEESTKPESPNQQESNKKPETEENQKKKPDDKAEEPAPTPEEIARQQKLIEADKLYLAGNVAEAEKIYREVKEPFKELTNSNSEQRQPAITDATQLPPAGKVYWREAEAGILSKLETRTLVPLELLVKQVPEFIPGHLKYAEALTNYNRKKEALQVLERAATLYPNQPDLVKARVTALADEKKFMEAALAARQYAMLNQNDPLAPEFTKLAETNLKRYKSYIRGEIRGNAIANIITGALGYAVTGSLLGPFSALDSTILLLQGEESIGESVAKQARKQLDLVKDEEVNAYVNEIGQKLAKVAGRNEFKYEFFVIPEADLNAFALPGGKIFINAGAIAKAKSEAELAGLIGHELSHVVLSHGFQLVTQGNLISNVTQYLPLGGTIGQLFGLSYSRDMERQADVLGTRLLVASNYAADGLRNLMVTLKQQQKNAPPTWASSHPGGNERVRYLEDLIASGGYNRYAYEGVAKHQEMQEKAKAVIKLAKECREDKKKCPEVKKPENEQTKPEPSTK